MIIYLISGFLLGTIGITILTSITDIISGAVEIFKAFASLKIMGYNAKIESLSNPQEETHTRAIGFATTFEEDEENDE